MDDPEHTEGRINRALSGSPELAVSWDGDLVADGESAAFYVYWEGDVTPYWVEDDGRRLYVYAHRDGGRVELGDAKHYDDLAAVLVGCVSERR